MAKRRLTKREWAEAIREWRQSGGSRDEYCAKRELNPKTMAWWQRMLEGSSRPSPRGARRETGAAGHPQFVEVTTAVGIGAAKPVDRFDVVVRGIEIHVPAGFDASALTRLLSIVEARR